MRFRVFLAAGLLFCAAYSAGSLQSLSEDNSPAFSWRFGKTIGYGSSVERAARLFRPVHDYLWPPIFL